jgi:CheY-like chemotaxis protein
VRCQRARARAAAKYSFASRSRSLAKASAESGVAAVARRLKEGETEHVMTVQTSLQTDAPWTTIRRFPVRTRKSPVPRVLVVDDEPLIRWSCAETLGASGLRVIEVDNGEAAMFTLADPAGGTDVVLLDLILPDFRDLTLLEALRDLAPDVPIIVMTAFATAEIREDAHRLGAFMVVDKPFDMNQLVALVRAALRSAPAA